MAGLNRVIKIKEDDNKTHLRKAITKVADKNIRLLPQFREKYPEYKNAYSKISDKCSFF